MSESGDRYMKGVATGAGVRQKFGSQFGHTGRPVQLPEGEQTGIAGDIGSPELDVHRAVKTNPKRFPASLTLWVPPVLDRRSPLTCYYHKWNS